MPLIESLEDKIKELNAAYESQLQLRYEKTRQSIPYKLLQELIDEHNLMYYGRVARVKPELHDSILVIPRRGIGFPLRSNFHPEPITPFMQKVGIEQPGHFIDYYPGWKEFLELRPEYQYKVLEVMDKYNLKKAKLQGGDDCATLIWQEQLGTSSSEIHSSWLYTKPRDEMSLRELTLCPPRPRTESEWRESIRKKYLGYNI